jgi:hypothetical protein
MEWGQENANAKIEDTTGDGANFAKRRRPAAKLEKTQ